MLLPLREESGQGLTTLSALPLKGLNRQAMCQCRRSTAVISSFFCDPQRETNSKANPTKFKIECTNSGHVDDWEAPVGRFSRRIAMEKRGAEKRWQIGILAMMLF
jgi:hypothetical protein